jgi:hypothetical protein
MPCGPCEQRRRMIAEAYKKGGYIRVLKQIPRVSAHLVKNPPKVKPK